MRVLLAVILAVCAAGAFLARAERAEVTIRIAFLASNDDEDYVGAMAFKQSVEAAAGSRVAVQVFPSGQYCGNERECIEALQGGMLEMHQTTFGGLAALFGPAQALDLPYTFADDAVAECVMDGPLLAQMGDAILEQGLGLRLMAVGNTGGWRSFATTRQRIQSPADLARLRIRTLPSALEQEMVRLLGASPTPLPWSEVYYALSAGLLDGTKNSVQDVVGMKLHEHVRFLPFHHGVERFQSIIKVPSDAGFFFHGDGIADRDPLTQARDAEFEAAFPHQCFVRRQDELGASSADVHHQRRLRTEGYGQSNTCEDQFGLLITRDDADGDLQALFCATDEVRTIACVAQGRGAEGRDP